MIWLIVGGTGTFGRAALRQLLPTATKIRILSRDEYKQAVLLSELTPAERSRVVPILGDVRDPERITQAVEGVDHVLHAAALKRIERCQADVEEATKTNVIGSLNVAKAAVRAGVKSAVLISSDKAADPVNAYGATKAMAEHIFLTLGRSWGGHSTRLLAVRYGNVWGSRGSVIELWRRWWQRTQRPLMVTDPEATRYFFGIEQGVELATWAARHGAASHLLVPAMKAARMGDVAEASGWLWERGDGLRDAEKRHETLLTAAEAGRAERLPGVDGWQVAAVTGSSVQKAKVRPALTSETAERLTLDELRQMWTWASGD